MTTQLCFDPAAIGSWIAARRAEGLTLPVHIGLPGVAEPHKLLAITRPDRRRRHASVPDEERAVRRAADPLRRLLPARRAARGPRPDRRRPGGRRRGPAPVHVQQRRGDRGLATALPRIAGGRPAGLTRSRPGPQVSQVQPPTAFAVLPVSRSVTVTSIEPLSPPPSTVMLPEPVAESKDVPPPP